VSSLFSKFLRLFFLDHFITSGLCSGPPVSRAGVLGRVPEMARPVGVEVRIDRLGPGVRLGGLDLRDRITRDPGSSERLQVSERSAEGVRGGGQVLTSEREAEDLQIVGDLGSYQGGS
jgi:hypothetical protein